MSKRAFAIVSLFTTVVVALLVCYGVWGTACSPAKAKERTVDIPQSNEQGVSLTATPIIKSDGISFDSVTAFLEADKTEDIPYSAPDFVCRHFADTIIANAELAGIKCGNVTVIFEDGGCHALNAFETIDEGIVFVDCSTGYDAFVQLGLNELYEWSFSLGVESGNGCVASGVVVGGGKIVLNYRVAWGPDTLSYDWADEENIAEHFEIMGEKYREELTK